MATLKDLLADCRGHSGPVIETPARTAPYTYDEFVPNVWKSGNLFGHYGLHPGASATVLSGAKEATASDHSGRADAADPLVAALGATMVGATVRLTATEPIESRVLVLPAGWTARYETAPQCSVVAYGGPPEKAAVVHFEQEMWSENPIEPPERVAESDAALATVGETFDHGTLVATARELASEFDLDADSTVVLDAPFDTPGAVVGLVAVLSAGATLLLVPVAGDDAADTTVELSLTTASGETDTAVDNEEGAVSVASLTQRLRDTHRV